MTYSVITFHHTREKTPEKEETGFIIHRHPSRSRPTGLFSSELRLNYWSEFNACEE
jgi:hypothetical protein